MPGIGNAKSPTMGRMTKLGFIGAGNMAGAIIRGMVAGGTAPTDIAVSDPRHVSAAAIESELGVRALASNAEILEFADYVVLAVKPQVLEPVLAELQGSLTGQVIVSIAAGMSLDRIGRACPPETPIVRVMPNVNAQIGAGMAAVAGNDFSTAEHVATVLSVFNSVGRAIALPEKDFAAFSALAGAGPALAFEFIEALARGGLRHGLPKDLAVEVAAQTLLGSARLVLERDSSPTTLRDTVTSPGGTTIAGLVAAEAAGFSASVVQFVDGVVSRDKELGAN